MKTLVIVSQYIAFIVKTKMKLCVVIPFQIFRCLNHLCFSMSSFLFFWQSFSLSVTLLDGTRLYWSRCVSVYFILRGLILVKRNPFPLKIRLSKCDSQHCSVVSCEFGKSSSVISCFGCGKSRNKRHFSSVECHTFFFTPGFVRPSCSFIFNNIWQIQAVCFLAK